MKKKRVTQLVTLVLVTASVQSCSSNQQVAEQSITKTEKKFKLDSILTNKHQNLRNINQGTNLVVNFGKESKNLKKQNAKISAVDSITIRGGFGSTGFSKSVSS